MTVETGDYTLPTTQKLNKSAFLDQNRNSVSLKIKTNSDYQETYSNFLS